jgi:hypothetical protein
MKTGAEREQGSKLSPKSEVFSELRGQKIVTV